MAKRLAPGALPRLLGRGSAARLALAMLAAGAVLLEVLLRTPPVRAHLPVPSLGTPYLYLDQVIARLDVFADAGRVDCLFMGSCGMASDVDPAVFGAAYGHETGRQIRCFNAGFPGLPAAAAPTMARLLVARYRPALLVYGTLPGDYTPDAAREFGSELDAAPWVRYQLGQPTVRGWLIDHSLAYRTILALRDRLDPARREELRLEDTWPHTSDLGFLEQRVRMPHMIQPGSSEQMLQVFAGRDVAPEAISGLSRVLALRGQGVQVLLVALPTHPVLRKEVDGAAESVPALVGRVRAQAGQDGAPFWDAMETGVVPDEDWTDVVHMHLSGAALFSDWLGARVGRAVVQGELADPVGAQAR